MMRTLVVGVSVWMIGFFCVAVAHGKNARVQVATLDGAPVYHWRIFDSALTDDVDRALVLREFERRGFKLPERFVQEQMQAAIKTQSGGNEARFVERLRQQGATLADYRQFVMEEIIVVAMLYQKMPDEQARERWLTDLRANARVKRLRAAPNASK